MFEVRKDEPSYAFIPNVDTPEKNQYGKDIKLVNDDSPLAGKSLNINNNSQVGNNPNRYLQHGFHFTADNCIGCHACESACSEKNQLPAHISFRSVGYVEGGTYPAYQRINISMACNHCDDPVCLKGCPTRAYTKFAEYGAVLQDPDICFGCGYCTWVCPYNAPQLDPIQGHVSKCNMCVDRLEVGLKPACAAACLGGALDFGLIETTPANRDQIKTQIPGFPSPEITKPNIRFQQTKVLPKEMTRPDTMPVRYQRDEQGESEFKSKSVLSDKPRGWNLAKLRSREDPLVIFTLISQAVVGAFSIVYFGSWLGVEPLTYSANPVTVGTLLVLMFVMQSFALAISTMHLGKPHRFYRAFNNFDLSPVSREVASLSVFFGFFVAYSGFNLFEPSFMESQFHSDLKFLSGIGAMTFGPVFIYAMHKIYRIKARPFWNHWQVLTSFFGSVLTLGSLLVGLVVSLGMTIQGQDYSGLMSLLAWPMVAGLVLEGLGLWAHARYLESNSGEASAAHMNQRTSYGYTYICRNAGIAVSAVLALALAILAPSGLLGLALWLLLGVLITATALVGRALFYVLVIPTTMPGAFFWRNQGFQEHARESGLAEMPQVGVLPRTEYHELQMERAKREIAEDLNKIREKGLKNTLRFLKSTLLQRI